MAKPVVIDDGGSTRIRQIKSNVRMDGLLNAPFKDSPDEPFVANAQGVFCYLTVRYFADTGAAHNTPADPGQPLMLGDAVTIDGGNGQLVTITLPRNHPGKMIIALDPGAAPDVVPNTSNAGIFRYVVMNADSMQNVTYTSAAGNATVLFDATHTPAIFTMVHFKPS